MSCSRFSPLSTNPGALAKSVSASCSSYEVQAAYGAAIVVFVVTHDQPFGHAFDPSRIARERFWLIGHLTILEKGATVLPQVPRSARRDVAGPDCAQRLLRTGPFLKYDLTR